jgi:hypothetical protein
MQADCPEGQALRIMIADVKRSNERAVAFLNRLATTDPDLLLVMETDVFWHERLSVLNGQFRHRLQKIPNDPFYGMQLFWRMELIASEFWFLLDVDTLTAVMQLRL